MTDLADQVAREVMGWERRTLSMAGECEREWWCDPSLGARWMVSEWTPEIDPRDWMRIVERMEELGWSCVIYHHIKRAAFIRREKCILNNPNPGRGKADDIGTAICEAALAAVGSQ